MRTKTRPGGNTKGQKQASRAPSDRNPPKSLEKTGSHGSRVAPKESHPDKHGGSGTGRQQGGSGAGRER